MTLDDHSRTIADAVTDLRRFVIPQIVSSLDGDDLETEEMLLHYINYAADLLLAQASAMQATRAMLANLGAAGDARTRQFIAAFEAALAPIALPVPPEIPPDRNEEGASHGD